VLVVPLKATLCGLPAALSMSMSEPELGDELVGVNVTPIVQEPLGAMPGWPSTHVPPETAKGAAAVKLVRTNDATLLLLFCTVTVIGLLVVLIGVAGKVTLAGSVMVSGFTPVPDKPTDCSVPEPLALLVTFKSP
jgi:hypothetical protein